MQCVRFCVAMRRSATYHHHLVELLKQMQPRQPRNCGSAEVLVRLAHVLWTFHCLSTISCWYLSVKRRRRKLSLVALLPFKAAISAWRTLVSGLTHSGYAWRDAAREELALEAFWGCSVDVPRVHAAAAAVVVAGEVAAVLGVGAGFGQSFHRQGRNGSSQTSRCLDSMWSVFGGPCGGFGRIATCCCKSFGPLSCMTFGLQTTCPH
mmetsp:Transcript_95232/g.188694  ORF Transcript_95232/g.188694 Transcript_95232/m.188694 type:complete len:207 (+) Transcript_95232:168-788(+)